MRERKTRYFFIIMVFIMIQLWYGCSSKEETQKEVTASSQTHSKEMTVVKSQSEASARESKTDRPSAAKPTNLDSNIVIEVEGQVLTREVLDKELNKAMAILKNQLPADLPEDRMDDYKQRVRNRIIEGFVSRTLLKGEIERKNVKVSDQELGIEIDKIRASLPPGVTMEDLMKENNVSKVKMDEDIRFALQIKKLATSEAKDKLRPTAEEIKNYYQANKEKFNSPESVRARHILIAKDSKDDTETKAGKKAKLESIRKQIIDGADFADLAGKYSDCPSKNNGGDLGTFTKGQMVKPFEDAAFSQKVDEVGPVIETDFGYHIIRVTEKNQASATALDEPLKNRISAVLEQQKIQDTLTNMLQRLREKAKIVSHEN